MTGARLRHRSNGSGSSLENDTVPRQPRVVPARRGPKSAPVEGEHELFGFLTTEANAGVAPIHPKAMPVILTSPAEVDTWLEG